MGISETDMYALAAFSKDRLALVKVPIPEPDDYEGCVFCNSTDKMIVEHLFSTPDYPVLIGHESFGKVIKVGKKVKKYQLGDRVICSNAIVNGFDGTYYSTWGGFAEYGISGDLDAYLADGGVLDEKNAYRARYAANAIIPADFSAEKAALVFSLSEVAGALMEFGDIAGKRVVIFGTGIVGYFFTYFAKQFGAAEAIVLGRRESRLEIARQIGADKTFIKFDDAVQYLNETGGADVVFECSGNWKVLENGFSFLKENGTLAVYAVPHQPYAVDFQNCPASFCFKRIGPQVEMAKDLVCNLLKENVIPVEKFLTHVYPLSQAVEAYNEVCNGNVIKALVQMPCTEE